MIGGYNEKSNAYYAMSTNDFISCVLFVLSTAVLFTSCKNREQTLSQETAYEDAQMNAMNKKVVKCINEKDKKGLKNLFSKSAQKNIEDLDGKIDELFNVFDGKIIKSV